MILSKRITPASIIFLTLLPGYCCFSTVFVRSNKVFNGCFRSPKMNSYRWTQCQPGSKNHGIARSSSLQMVLTRRSILSTAFLLYFPTLGLPDVVASVEDIVLDSTEDQGWAPITKSSIGQSIRYSAVRGARTFDKLDEFWARFSDSLRDTKKCDPATNRRLYDNGFRRDGTRVGDPVLGALCDPVEMRPISDDVSRLILTSSFETFTSISTSVVKTDEVEQAIQKIANLVRPSFERSQTGVVLLSEEDSKKRQSLVLDLYVQMRAFSEEMEQVPSWKGKDRKRLSQTFELTWGEKLVKELAPRADRNNFKSPLPPFQLPESFYPYNTDKLLDALGVVSAALQSLQNSGIIGFWEILIPPDDNGDVVTIAVDNDTTLPVQILLQEQRKIFRGSLVTAIVAAAMEKSQIRCNIDTFFIDPSTTNQEQYNPTQLLLNLSALNGTKD